VNRYGLSRPLPSLRKVDAKPADGTVISSFVGFSMIIKSWNSRAFLLLRRASRRTVAAQGAVPDRGARVPTHPVSGS
jgi:hypothetical protein